MTIDDVIRSARAFFENAQRCSMSRLEEIAVEVGADDDEIARAVAEEQKRFEAEWPTIEAQLRREMIAWQTVGCPPDDPTASPTSEALQ